jgi:NADH-quinone oxidoreductase subunit D
LQAVPYFDRLDYVSPMCQEHAYALAVEKLLGLTIPERAQYIRVLFSEITRILNHILNVTTFAMDVGAITPTLWGFEQRELLIEFYEGVSGSRMHAAYFRPGGVHADLPAGMLDKMEGWLKQFPPFVKDLERLLNDNRIFKQRTVDIGITSKQQALDWAFSGPMLRAAGVAWDLRKAQPYDVYDRMDFDIPVGKTGDCYARYLVRIEEMYQSARIMQQCIDALRSVGGPVRVDDRKITPPRRAEMKTSMEALIHHFKIVAHGFFPPVGEAYAAIEAPKGELGFYFVSDGTPRPWRMKVRSPSFVNLQTLPTMVEGRLVADVITAIGSLDIVLGEIDR